MSLACFLISLKHFNTLQFSFTLISSFAINPPALSSSYFNNSLIFSVIFSSLIREITFSFFSSGSSDKISTASSLSSSFISTAISFSESSFKIFSLTSSSSSVRTSDVLSLSISFIK